MSSRLFDRLGWAFGGAALVTLVLIIAGVVSAGPLDPPSAPSGPSGVFGAGTPISSLPLTISTPGSYYLTGNLTGVSGQNGIIIASNDVSIDMRGFTLTGVAGTGDGIRTQTPTLWRGIQIRNGTARGWGGSGFQLQTANGGVFDSLIAEGNSGWGFVIGEGGTISHCTAVANAFSGVNATVATVSGCVSEKNGGHGYQISNVVLTDCVANYNTFNGVMDTGVSRVDGCIVRGNQAIGIETQSSQVTDNNVQFNAGTGIDVSSVGSVIARNEVTANSQTGTGQGIRVTGDNARVEDNHVVDYAGFAVQDVGIAVTGAGNVVIGNSAHNNVANYSLAGAGGSYGPLQNAATATSPFANIDY